jgi:hypothetical protein
MHLYRGSLICLLFVSFALPSQARSKAQLIEYDLDTVTEFVGIKPGKKQAKLKLRVSGLDSESVKDVELYDEGLNNKFLRIRDEDRQVQEDGVVDFNLRIARVRVNPLPTTLYLRTYDFAGFRLETIALNLLVFDDKPVARACVTSFLPSCFEISFERFDDEPVAYYVYNEGYACSIYNKFDVVDLSVCGVDANGESLN